MSIAPLAKESNANMTDGDPNGVVMSAAGLTDALTRSTSAQGTLLVVHGRPERYRCGVGIERQESNDRKNARERGDRLIEIPVATG
jgi:hypothetical protein